MVAEAPDRRSGRVAGAAAAALLLAGLTLLLEPAGRRGAAAVLLAAGLVVGVVAAVVPGDPDHLWRPSPRHNNRPRVAAEIDGEARPAIHDDVGPVDLQYLEGGGQLSSRLRQCDVKATRRAPAQEFGRCDHQVGVVVHDVVAGHVLALLGEDAVVLQRSAYVGPDPEDAPDDQR